MHPLYREQFFDKFTFQVYVKSNTLLGDAKHATGVVLAEIVKANIPVRNGVVHLIHRPLMIIDTTVTQFLQVSHHDLKHDKAHDFTIRFFKQKTHILT